MKISFIEYIYGEKVHSMCTLTNNYGTVSYIESRRITAQMKQGAGRSVLPIGANFYHKSRLMMRTLH